MITEIRASNLFIFEKPICFTLKADMRNKRFGSNIYQESNNNVLKVAGLYGANNSGKTCLIKCIDTIKNILLNKPANIKRNMFSENLICELGISFISEGQEYSYDFKYDTVNDNYIYERFAKRIKDKYGNEKEEIWLLIDKQKNIFKCADKTAEKLIPDIAGNNLIINVLNTDKFEVLRLIKTISSSFASKIDIINLENIPLDKTIDILKNKNNIKTKVVNLIKNADLYLDNIEIVDSERLPIDINNRTPDEFALQFKQQLIDRLHLASTYRGISVPSLLFDSTGTKKMTALASYIIEALEQGRILIVDELDSSLHFKLTRAIVAMFNNELNRKAQLLFSCHDVNLMDCKKLFRKEQIWFIHKDRKDVYLYSLADFTAEMGVRETTDIVEKYRKGLLGALPEPELINSLLEINGNKKEVKYEK